MDPIKPLPEDLKKIVDEWERIGYDISDILSGVYDNIELFVNNSIIVEKTIEHMKAILDYDVKKDPKEYIDIEGRLIVDVDVFKVIDEILEKLLRYYEV